MSDSDPIDDDEPIPYVLTAEGFAYLDEHKCDPPHSWIGPFGVSLQPDGSLLLEYDRVSAYPED